MERQKIADVVIEYLSETTKAVLQRNKEGLGKKILGEVVNRPDDLEIEIDHVGGKILQRLLEKHGIHATVFSEQQNGDIQTENPDFFGAVDPFDNSVLFLKGFRHTWYTVLSFFDTNGNFLAGGIGDILNATAQLSDGVKNFLLDMKSGAKIPTAPSLTKTLQDSSAVLASYVMSSQYSTKFFQTFAGLVNHMHPKALLYPYGGAHIYGFLADGKVDAYIMFDEPRSEIDPGFGIAKAAGCYVGEVDEKGNWKDYEFLSEKQHDKIGLLVAASTRELRDEIVDYYKKQAQKL